MKIPRLRVGARCHLPELRQSIHQPAHSASVHSLSAMSYLNCLLLLLLVASPAQTSRRSLAWPFTGIMLDALGLDKDYANPRIAMSSMPEMSSVPSNCVRAILNCCQLGQEGGR